jgi:aminoglycoside phosphotransferase family enzyme/predicted kinase
MTFNISNMLKPEVYDHPAKNIELIETHISWVILSGAYAYKIKKPVNFGFLDFSTLEKRKKYCEQELELNRRLAADIYLDVVAITGSTDEPRISGSGTAFEYAVRMLQFPQSAQLDNMLASNSLKLKHMDAIARMVADFHQSTNIANDSMAFGDKHAVYQPIEENFRQIEEHPGSTECSDDLEKLEQWSKAEFIQWTTVFEQRKSNGLIRQCHGDMHLRNLLWLNNKPMAFDCIEFNAKLSWIDVISDIAFLIMDLQHRQQHKLASRFLNRYLELTGDYAGLSVLPFYLCYRAMVRAKVNALRMEQKSLTLEEKKKTIDEFKSYIELAIRFTQRPAAKLIIMSGMSASGKSTLSQQLLDKLGAIRIRSDIERKRLFGIVSTDNTADKVGNNINTGIYSTEASKLTYEKLITLTSMSIKAGYSVVVDAAFLKYKQRKPFQKLAEHLDVPYKIIQVSAPAEILRQRIMQRKNDISDADLTVLEHQLNHWQPLPEEEMRYVAEVNSSEPLDINQLIEKINKI